MNKLGPISKSQITTFAHCAACLQDGIPVGQSPRDWMRFEVGFTKLGIQVWCVRHEMNVVHLDFQGQKVVYADG